MRWSRSQAAVVNGKSSIMRIGYAKPNELRVGGAAVNATLELNY
jgi:hypothetical protein